MINRLSIAIKECERLSALKGDKFSIPVVSNGRLTSSLGRVISVLSEDGKTYYPEKMEIAKRVLERGSDKDIIEITRHEWCHYYLSKTLEECHGHDSVFNALARSVDAQEGATGDVSFKEDYKYETFCVKCGKRTGCYQRAGKTVKHPHLYHSGCCGASIRVVQNR